MPEVVSLPFRAERWLTDWQALGGSVRVDDVNGEPDIWIEPPPKYPGLRAYPIDAGAFEAWLTRARTLYELIRRDEARHALLDYLLRREATKGG